MPSEIKALLEKHKSELHQWSIVTKELSRDESYLNAAGLEQSRNVIKKEICLNLWVPKNKGRLGFFSQNIKLDGDLPLRIEKMIEMAHLSSQEAWVFPKSEAPREFSKSSYEAFEKDLKTGAHAVLADLEKAIDSEKTADFNSAELFVTQESIQHQFSTGFEGRHKRSKIYGEVCFSAGNESDSNEFLVTRMGAHPEQMNFEEMCSQSATGAKALLEAEPIDSGRYDCLVDCEILGQIFSDALSHLDAENRYYNMPFQQVGSDFIPGFSGTPFEVRLDPSIEFGLGSCAFSSDSSPQDKLLAVANNIVESNLVSAQMGQYLNMDPTTVKANLVIQADEGTSREKILSQSRVLEILQFSALFSSPRDLAFSSEIRLARLWEPGKQPRYVKGGNFSGQFRENCKNILFSSEQQFRNLNEEALEYPRAYSGPAFGLLNDVQVSS